MADGRAFAAAANATRWRRTVNSCCFNFVVNFVVNFVAGFVEHLAGPRLSEPQRIRVGDDSANAQSKG